MAPPSTPDKYPPREAFDKIITINVGVKTEDAVEGTNTFKVHKGVLCFYSGYFNACLNGDFVEARSGVVDLVEEDPDRFKDFVGWLYTRQLPVDHESKDVGEQWRDVFRLWVFADKRQVPLLANRCINALRELNVVRWCAPTTELHFVYANTTADSLLRRFLVYLIAMVAGPGGDRLLGDSRDRYPPDALWDILKLVWGNGSSKAASMSVQEILAIDLCKFHQHEDGVRCPPESTAHIKKKEKS
ncbi:hypothetical protein CB0940_08159 [Cercospora beticola]|uniref:BTB domain-containing protein n=1 Tax=Cercospora beticola TaxID=122368 RepID=A0A2G5HR29_CERBT|nr:hypothetical protein CB0940_08159 [Cercospora beticola]PIA95006.1 hypothetical protein CB0940_08159 [Cercospora beticola]WPB04725.1 hypothetical protein RHO25_009372 [Cercospora beticola]